MDDTEKQFHSERTAATAKSDAQSKTARTPKPSSDSFLEEWRNSLIDGKANIGKLRALLTAGCIGDLRPEQIAQLYESLIQNITAAERLAVVLATQRRLGRANGISRALLNRLRLHFSEAIEYQSDDFAAANGSQAIERFVETNAPRTIKSSESDQFTAGKRERAEPTKERIRDDSWLRQFFVCLCTESEQRVFLSGLIAVGKWWLAGNAPAFMKDHDDANLSRAVSNALSAASISKQRWELLFAGIVPLERQFAVLLNRELELIRRVRSQDTEIESLRRERVNLVNRFASEEAAKNAAQDDVSRLQQALNEANEKYQLLDQHWRAVSDQSLKKQSGSFRERIGHEVQEALLSLERQTPNVSMALLRLKRIDEIVSNSGSREE
jgi:hypothetical protein